MLSGSFTSKEEKGKTTASMKLSVMEMFNIELNIEEKIKYDAKLTKVDVSDAVSGEDLTDKDLEKLEKLEESKGIKKLMEDLEKVDMSSLMSSFGGSSSMDF